MNNTLESFKHIMNEMTQEGYVAIMLSVLGIFFFLYIYSLAQEKKKLRKTLEDNLKVFKQAFEISEDAVLILSDKNEVIYANNTMVRLLQLNDDFLLKTFESIVQIKVKKDWLALDKFIEDNRIGPKEKICSYPHSTLKISEDDEIPIHLYLDTIVMRMPNEVLCDVITIQDMTKEKERSGTHFRHQLTNLPNQLQAYHDLPAFFSKAHLEKNKLALMLLS